MNNYLVLGDWNAVCDRCGLRHKASELRKEWTGLMVCQPCWEPRHPQTLIKINPEIAVPSWTRPEPPDVFIEVPALLFAEDGAPIFTESGEGLDTDAT